ncbi:MAG: hypothetical protein JKY42_11700 [Flavobacteriales bacterium]|nr:hypothetical protein [Flavobacteriales bacterium]
MIIGVAVKFTCGKEIRLPNPNRHADCFNLAKEKYGIRRCVVRRMKFNSYQSQLQEYLQASTLTPGRYCPSNQVKTCEHASEIKITSKPMSEDAFTPMINSLLENRLEEVDTENDTINQLRIMVIVGLELGLDRASIILSDLVSEEKNELLTGLINANDSDSEEAIVRDFKYDALTMMGVLDRDKQPRNINDEINNMIKGDSANDLSSSSNAITYTGISKKISSTGEILDLLVEDSAGNRLTINESEYKDKEVKPTIEELPTQNGFDCS